MFGIPGEVFWPTAAFGAIVTLVFCGLAVLRILPHSRSRDLEPADRATLEELRARLGQIDQLQQRVGFKKPGETVRITVLRGRGERRAFTVRLAAAPRDRTDVAARDQPGDQAGPAVEGVREERLGITVEPLTAELTGRSARLRELLAQGGGLVVTAVSADGPSYQRLFGTEDGGPDIITRVNERPVKSRADLVAALQEHMRVFSESYSNVGWTKGPVH